MGEGGLSFIPPLPPSPLPLLFPSKMVFLVNTATEIDGEKHNYELSFRVRPNIEELRAEAEAVFGRVTSGGEFLVERMQVFDDVLQGWMDLRNPQQLAEGCQVFAIEVERVHPMQLADPTSPGRSRMQASTPHERARELFHSLAITRADGVTVTEFVAGLLALRLDFSEARLYELFDRADADSDGLLNLSEFFAFSQKYPSLTDTAYYRKRDLHSEFAVEKEATRLRVELASLDERTRENHETLRVVEHTEQENRAKLRSHEGNIALVKQREREASQKLTKTSADVESAARRLEECRRRLGITRDDAYAKEAALTQAETDSEVVRRTVEDSQREVDAHHAKIEAMQRQIEHHRAELDKCVEDTKICSGNYAAAETRKRLAEEDATSARKAANLAASMVSEAERDFRGKLKVEEGAVADASSASLAMDREIKQYDSMASAALQARNRKEDLLLEEVQARQHRNTILSQKDNVDLDTRILSEARARDDKEEMHFIERELTLRDQRHTLERKEHTIRAHMPASVTSISPAPLLADYPQDPAAIPHEVLTAPPLAPPLPGVPLPGVPLLPMEVAPPVLLEPPLSPQIPVNSVVGYPGVTPVSMVGVGTMVNRQFGHRPVSPDAASLSPVASQATMVPREVMGGGGGGGGGGIVLTDAERQAVLRARNIAAVAASSAATSVGLSAYPTFKAGPVLPVPSPPARMPAW